MAEGRRPTEEEIKQLPRWARVAFAARCARRVQPLYKAFWPEAPQEHLEAVNKAIKVAEACAAADARTENASIAAHFASAADNAASAARAARGSAFAGGYAAASAAHAATAANHCIRAARGGRGPAFAGGYAAASAAHTAVTAVAGAPHASDAFSQVLRDLDLLRSVAESEKWTDETRVPPEFFGPMWPDGAPDGWPEVPQPVTIVPDTLHVESEICGPLSIYIDPSAYSPDEAGELLAILSDIYESVSGDRLVIDGTGQAAAQVDEPVLPRGGA